MMQSLDYLRSREQILTPDEKHKIRYWAKNCGGVLHIHSSLGAASILINKIYITNFNKLSYGVFPYFIILKYMCDVSI